MSFAKNQLHRWISKLISMFSKDVDNVFFLKSLDYICIKNDSSLGLIMAATDIFWETRYLQFDTGKAYNLIHRFSTKITILAKCEQAILHDPK